VLTRSGEVIDEADEHAATIYADIDVDLLATTRRNLPVTVQRRFEVYPDVSKQ
jgi:predicted amidohydrolase